MACSKFKANLLPLADRERMYLDIKNMCGEPIIERRFHGDSIFEIFYAGDGVTLGVDSDNSRLYGGYAIGERKNVDEFVEKTGLIAHVVEDKK
jgi:hypothetical protein